VGEGTLYRLSSPTLGSQFAPHLGAFRGHSIFPKSGTFPGSGSVWFWGGNWNDSQVS
jgi:hypothetical protein